VSRSAGHREESPQGVPAPAHRNLSLLSDGKVSAGQVAPGLHAKKRGRPGPPESSIARRQTLRRRRALAVGRCRPPGETGPPPTLTSTQRHQGEFGGSGDSSGHVSGSLPLTSRLARRSPPAAYLTIEKPSLPRPTDSG